MKYDINQEIANICCNSLVQEVSSPKYQAEIDFNLYESEQEQFFNISESLLQEGSITDAQCINYELSEADHFSIETKEKTVTYTLYITFYHHNWQGDLPLQQFVPKFLLLASQSDINLTKEYEENEGVYLQLKVEVTPEYTIGTRIKEMSKTLSKLQSKVV